MKIFLLAGVPFLLVAILALSMIMIEKQIVAPPKFLGVEEFTSIAKDSNGNIFLLSPKNYILIIGKEGNKQWEKKGKFTIPIDLLSPPAIPLSYFLHSPYTGEMFGVIGFQEQWEVCSLDEKFACLEGGKTIFINNNEFWVSSFTGEIYKK